MIQKIISGAQTGADRAGIDAAIELNIEYGGWVPKGRKASKASGIYDVVKDKIMQVLK
jgi:hypothetical protein